MVIVSLLSGHVKKCASTSGTRHPAVFKLTPVRALELVDLNGRPPLRSSRHTRSDGRVENVDDLSIGVVGVARSVSGGSAEPDDGCHGRVGLTVLDDAGVGDGDGGGNGEESGELHLE